MNARKNARVDMLNAVVNLFKLDNAAYTFAPALQEDIEELEALVADLDVSLEKAELPTTTLTAAKQALKATIVATAKKLIGAGNALASKQENKQLKEELTQFGKQLDKAKDAELPLVSSNLIAQLRRINESDLAQRGVTATDITTFEAQVNQFKVDLPKTKSARRKTSTEISKSEELTVKGCTIVTERITPTLLQIKDNIPSFHATFLKESTIRKPASISTQLKFVILDDATGEKIEDVTIRNGEHTLDAKTNLKQPSMSKKTQTAKTAKAAKATKPAKKNTIQSDILEIVKEGYQIYQLPVPKFKRGKITTVTVRLQPNAATPSENA